MEFERFPWQGERQSIVLRFPWIWRREYCFWNDQL